jgi:EpsI family protein
MRVRALVVAICLLATSAYLAHAERAEPTPIRTPLSELPIVIGGWNGQLGPAFSQAVLDVLRVDDYTRRSYTRADGRRVGFYVGYHATQRQGASIHSPLNCLPGSGWIPVNEGRLHLTVQPRPGGPVEDIEVKRVVIEQGIDRQLVLYWYQSHGRVVASEYWGKIYSVVDAIRLNRTDAALVRVIAPIPMGTGGIGQAERDAADFVRAVFPLLNHHLPL